MKGVSVQAEQLGLNAANNNSVVIFWKIDLRKAGGLNQVDAVPVVYWVWKGWQSVDARNWWLAEHWLKYEHYRAKPAVIPVRLAT